MAVKTQPGKQWGPNQANANDAPDWRVYAGGTNTPDPTDDSRGNDRNPNLKLTGNAIANVVATKGGWALSHDPVGLQTAPFAVEPLVAIGGLKMPALTALYVTDLSPVVVNAAGQVLTVQVQLSSGAIVAPANVANVYIVAIGDDAATANVNLAYSVAKSSPESGVLVFVSPTLNLASADTNSSYTVNSTSTFHGNTNISSRKQKGPALLLTGSLPGGGASNGMTIHVT